MPSISASVGIQGKNNTPDVEIIRQLLLRHSKWLDGEPMPTSGPFSPADGQAVAAFQSSAGALRKPDGRVDPHGFTLRRLNLPVIPAPKHRVFMNICLPRSDSLEDADFKAAAKSLNCDTNSIKAVAKVEVSDRGPFEKDTTRPTILFERHYFRKFTAGKYNVTHTDISGPQGGYGRFSEQYPKLYRAAVLDEVAALKSASWGAFQIMGANYEAAGFSTVESFVDAMNESYKQHLKAFVSFIQSNTALHAALKRKDWANFARKYNGPDYQKNQYDTKLANAYRMLNATEQEGRGSTMGHR